MRQGSTSWQDLAIANNLSFVPGKFPHEPAKIVGVYRGYHLQLMRWTFGIEITLTTEQELSQVVDNKLFNRPIKPRIHRLLTEPHLTAKIGGYFRADNKGRKFLYHEIAGSELLTAEVERFQRLINCLIKLANDYRKLLALGGEAMPALTKKLTGYAKLPALALQLLSDIENDTKQRLAKRSSRLYCERCLTCCEARRIDIPSLLEQVDLSYYGCRHCGQSRRFLEGWLIALLDNELNRKPAIEQDQLKVNWSERGSLFDFDEVVIIHATDEEAERFAIQVGNDTDPFRKSRYPTMRCKIAPTCELSENTLKILGRMFGKLERTTLF